MSGGRRFKRSAWFYDSNSTMGTSFCCVVATGLLGTITVGLAGKDKLTKSQHEVFLGANTWCGAISTTHAIQR